MAYDTNISAQRPRPHGPAQDFGDSHHHKPTKAVIGVAIMMAMGLLFYEIGGKSDAQHASKPPVAHQTVAWSHH